MTARPVTDDDLTMLRLIHAALRRDLATFSAAFDDIPEVTARVAGLRRQWVAFARQLHDHHNAEDQLVWPILRQRAGEAAEPVLAWMNAEHAAIDPAVSAIDRAFSDLTDRRGEMDPSELSAALAQVRELLEAHLNHEERHAIPLVRHHLTSADLDHVATVLRRQAGLRGAKAFLPWVLEGAPVADRDHVLRPLPPPLRWLVRRWELQRRELAFCPQ